MHVHQQHALATEHHRALLSDAARPTPTRSDDSRLPATRRRLGILLVEAGLHLIATADRSPLPTVLAR